MTDKQNENEEMKNENAQPEPASEEAEVVKSEAADEAPEEAEEVKAEPVVEEKKEEAVAAKAPEAKAEPVAEAKEAVKPSKELSGNLKKLAEQIEGLTVLEMADLASYLEEKFGVSAMPMAMGAPAAGTAGASEEPAEVKSSYNVVLTDGGANKLGAIKAVREIKPDLGLMDAKKLVESAPKPVLEGVKKDEAEAAVKKLTEAGAKAELQ